MNLYLYLHISTNFMNMLYVDYIYLHSVTCVLRGVDVACACCVCVSIFNVQFPCFNWIITQWILTINDLLSPLQHHAFKTIFLCVTPTLLVTESSTTLLLSYLSLSLSLLQLSHQDHRDVIGNTDTHKAGEQLYSAASVCIWEWFRTTNLAATPDWGRVN